MIFARRLGINRMQREQPEASLRTFKWPPASLIA
jgi:hypothetical protein